MNEDASATLFSRPVIEAVAERHGVGPDRLAEKLTAHQTAVEELPGVENIVYEWRKHYENPLIDQSESAYYLTVPRSVWDEFGDAIDVDADELAAIVDVHRRVVATRTDAPSEIPEDQAYVALDRTQ